MTLTSWLRWVARVVLALVLFCLTYVVYVAAHIWWIARQDEHPRSDAIVVLGASQYNGKPSPVFAARLAHAAALFREHVAPRVVTVGGKQPGDRFTEAQSGLDFLVTHGVPQADIVAVPTGSDTLRSLEAVHAAYRSHDWHSAVIVTDPWHCLRARTMARDLGLDANTSPERTGPAVDSRTTEIRYIARETEAYIYYELFHNDNEHSAGVI
ncbi:MAG TPA: YdcF family protein [Mycobacteriales bacterium]|nr:YdcF family protein [Mycobacteriales bacterium]